MIKLMSNKNRGGEVDTAAYSFMATENVRNLHTALDAYNVTPLSSTEARLAYD